MTLVDLHVPVVSWTEPEGIAVRGTLVLIPGRGERPAHYERFGRRIAADGYRVHAVTDPTRDAAFTESQVKELTGPETPGPRILVGSDTGALFAAGLAASGQVPGLDALVLAGLPTAETGLPTATGLHTEAGQAAAQSGQAAGPAAGPAPGSWDHELDTRTACPAHRARLSAAGVRRGALYEPVPEGWLEQADLAAVPQPVLGIHGADDPVSPLTAARARYAAASAELIAIAGGRHDALNDVTHRTVAATIILFLERLRLGQNLPAIAVRETLELASGQAR